MGLFNSIWGVGADWSREGAANTFRGILGGNQPAPEPASGLPGDAAVRPSPTVTPSSRQSATITRPDNLAPTGSSGSWNRIDPSTLPPRTMADRQVPGTPASGQAIPPVEAPRTPFPHTNVISGAKIGLVDPTYNMGDPVAFNWDGQQQYVLKDGRFVDPTEAFDYNPAAGIGLNEADYGTFMEQPGVSDLLGSYGPNQAIPQDIRDQIGEALLKVDPDGTAAENWNSAYRPESGAWTPREGYTLLSDADPASYWAALGISEKAIPFFGMGPEFMDAYNAAVYDNTSQAPLDTMSMILNAMASGGVRDNTMDPSVISGLIQMMGGVPYRREESEESAPALSISPYG